MKVKELIEALSEWDQDAEVLIYNEDTDESLSIDVVEQGANDDFVRIYAEEL